MSDDKKRAYYEANRERTKARTRARYAAKRDEIREKVKAYNASERGRKAQRDLKLRAAYGITLVEWEAMFDAQGRRCKSCGTCDPGSRKGWATDHSHVTKRVRGILCHRCNLAVGWLEKISPNPSVAMSRILGYLKE